MKNIGALLVVLAFVICLTLSACGSNSAEKDGAGAGADTTYTDPKDTQIEGNTLTGENVMGTGWQCTYHTDGGDKIYTRFILDEDGTYNQIIAINELYDHSEKGTYEVKDGKLYLYLNGDTNSSTVYEYKNGNLINNGNEFTSYAE